MVNINYQVTSESLTVREKLNELLNKRSAMENELKGHLEILTANNIGMTEPLVDSEGFPRQDLDVFQVRHARHRIIYLQNDLKDIMKKIQDNLHLFHAIDGAAAQEFSSASTQTQLNPIAKIGNVITNSPADKAGLLKDDFILEFGQVNGTNFKNLQDIVNIVKSSVNIDVPLQVLRNGTKRRITLKPQPFDGQGLVGCYFLNVENVER